MRYKHLLMAPTISPVTFRGTVESTEPDAWEARLEVRRSPHPAYELLWWDEKFLTRRGAVRELRRARDKYRHQCERRREEQERRARTREEIELC